MSNFTKITLAAVQLLIATAILGYTSYLLLSHEQYLLALTSCYMIVFLIGSNYYEIVARDKFKSKKLNWLITLFSPLTVYCLWYPILVACVSIISGKIPLVEFQAKFLLPMILYVFVLTLIGGCAYSRSLYYLKQWSKENELKLLVYSYRPYCRSLIPRYNGLCNARFDVLVEQKNGLGVKIGRVIIMFSLFKVLPKITAEWEFDR